MVTVVTGVTGEAGVGESPDHEYRSVTLPKGTDRETARQVLAIHAEFGEWELARHRVWPDGRRRVTLRRRRIGVWMPPLAT